MDHVENSRRFFMATCCGRKIESRRIPMKSISVNTSYHFLGMNQKQGKLLGKGGDHASQSKSYPQK